MKRLLLLTLSLVCIVELFAQKPLSQLAQIEKNGRWVTLEADVFDNPEVYLSSYKSDLGLNANEGFTRLEEHVDQLGMTHARFNQHHDDVRVEGAQYIVHGQSGRIIRSNGNLVKGIFASSEPEVSSSDAIEAALLYMDAERYYWQDPHKEALLKRVKKDQNATFYPNPELVYADKNYSQDGRDYRLAWKMEVFAEGPKGNKIIFIDAKDGHILFEVEGCEHTSVDGIAETRYSGTQTFQTDSVAPGHYRLQDDSRLARVETYNMRTLDPGFIPDSAVDFTDEDNYWDNANDEYDDAATDVHWGMQQTYDYFYDKHNRVSFDGDTAPIISYVHVRRNWFNARWTGAWAEFGDGSGNPLTSIDVVSHELTHGVTRNSSNLVYRNESGALNESFSDIFGNAVEFYAAPDSASWAIGVGNFLLRDMSDPKSELNPDTYLGQFWMFGDGDNGGVHTNSGVQNYWFYLLSEGGSGVNDNGDSYTVKGLGMDTAEAIAYRNLTTYLTASSTYDDARYGAILSAEDLYGPCSEAVYQTIHAWYAVGVGPDRVIDDLAVDPPSTPATYSCGFSDQETIAMDIVFRRSGCQNGIPPGTIIPVGYSLNDGTAVIDSFVLADSLFEGDTIHYVFPETVDLSQPGYYDFDFFATFDGDDNPQNDALATFTVTSVYTIDSSYLIAFNEFNRPVIPPYYTIENRRSVAMPAREAAATGFRGFLMSGQDVQQNSIDYPSSEDEVFTKNTDYESRICMCVDATSWDSLSIAFDLRQSYSEIYEIVASEVENINRAIGVRLIADEIPVSVQFYPDSIPEFVPDSVDIDTFKHHVVNLDQLAGTSFTLCFQGKHYVGKQDDFLNSGGDYSHIDNIEFITGATSSGTSSPRLDPSLINVYPNPATEILNVGLSARDLSINGWRIMSLTGQLVQQSNRGLPGNFQIRLNDFNRGIYFIEILTDEGRIVRKFIKE